MDLRRPMDVGSIATQGRADARQWVTSYTVDSSLDGDNWMEVANLPNLGQPFEGNSNRNSLRENVVNVFARYIRLNPTTFFRHPSLRWGVFSCESMKNAHR